MKYASEDLIKEHDGILLGLDILEKMVEKLRNEGDAEIGELKEIINFLKLFADKCHHGKEEVLLFPEMEKAGIPKEQGPIGQMLYEHNEGRSLIKKMEDGLDNNMDMFMHAASQYITLLRNHIYKENTILFPLGNKKISLDIQKHLLELFEKHEERVMGRGTHEKLHDLLFKFKKKYL